MKTPENDSEGKDKKHWSERCRDQMAKTKEFAQEFSGKSSGVVGKLYYASMLATGAAAGAAMLGVSGAASVAMAAAGVSKITKMLWDHVRDLKDAAEDIDEKSEEEIMARMDQTNSELEELWDLVAEQRKVIQMQSEASKQLQNSLELSDTRMTELKESHDNLAIVLKHFVGDKQANEAIGQAREAYREKYQREINEALESGDIEMVDFDPEKDPLVRAEQSECIPVLKDEVESETESLRL